MSRSTGRLILLLAVLALVPLLPLLFSQGNLLMWPGADISDLETAHLPLAEYINYSLVNWRQVPLWNPTILSGMPVAGDPLAGLAYPVLWSTYLLPQPATFHLLLWLHLIWAGLGLYRLGRDIGLGQHAAWVAGAALALSPRLLGQWGLGHATLVFAFSWTPWLLVGVRRSISGLKHRRRWWAWPSLTGGMLGLLASADPRWGIPAGLLALAYAIYLLIDPARPAWRASIAGGVVTIGSLVGSLSFLVLPMLQLLEHSQRAGLAFESAGGGGMPIASLLQLAVPNPSVWPEWGAAVGTGVFILAVLGLVNWQRGWFWAGVSLFSFLLSLGQATPLMGTLNSIIPGALLLRMPGRWFLLAGLAMPVLAGIGVEALLNPKDETLTRRLNLAVVGAGALAGSLAILQLLALPGISGPAGLVAILSLLVSLMLMGLALQGSSRVRKLLLGILIVVELLVLSLFGLTAREPIQSIPSGIQSELPTGFGNARLYTTGHFVSQWQAARQRLEMANGVHPLMLSSYWDFMADAVGYEPAGYSVTLPPMVGDLEDVAGSGIDTAELGLLRVTHVLSETVLDVEGLTEVRSSGGYWLYTLDGSRPRAWIEPVSAGENEWESVEVAHWSANRIELRASGPGTLVLSEVYYPFWQANVDGLPVEMKVEQGLFRGIELPAGDHDVVLQASSGRLRLGLLITALTWLVIGGLWWRR
ncbi:MAG: hypothetical protein ACLFWD_01915 [Anaerolineales bacterium]